MTLPGQFIEPTLTQGHTLVWSPGTTYQPGMVVVDRGGLWDCMRENKNSEPVSGNTNWTLVGGTPYVEKTVTPPELVTAPFYSAVPAAPGYPVIPAPGAGLWVMPTLQIGTVTDGDAWGSPPSPLFYWIDPTAINEQPFGAQASSADGGLSVNLATKNRIGAGPVFDSSMVFTADSFPPNVENAAVVMQSGTDITAGGTVFGTRSVIYRVYYLILPVTPPAGSTFYHITAVNQGTKTFTVTGDASALVFGQLVSVVGSTGNNRGYTVISATFGGVSTDIVVSQTIPSAVADGWIKVS